MEDGPDAKKSKENGSLNYKIFSKLRGVEVMNLREEF